MKLDLLYGNRVLTLPAAALERVSAAGANELKVLIALGDPAVRDPFDPQALGRAIGLSPEQVMGALAFWRGAGVLSCRETTEEEPVAQSESAASAGAGNSPTVEVPEKVPARTEKNGATVTILRSDDGMPHYTAEEINRIFAENGQLSGMIDECQNIFGKIFNPTEINRLMALNEYFRLDCEYILLLCYYCKKIGKTSIPYLDKLARSFYNEGIDNVDALGDRLGEMEEAADLGNYYRGLSGAGKRAFTEKETRFLNQWVKWNIAPELLKLAYEVAVDNTGSPSMPYTNKVLSNWKEAGYTTVEQVKTALEEYKQKKEGSAASSANNSFATDEFFEAALKRSLALYESENK